MRLMRLQSQVLNLHLWLVLLLRYIRHLQLKRLQLLPRFFSAVIPRVQVVARCRRDLTARRAIGDRNAAAANSSNVRLKLLQELLGPGTRRIFREIEGHIK